MSNNGDMKPTPHKEPAYDLVMMTIFIIMSIILMCTICSYLKAQDTIREQERKIETLETLLGKPLNCQNLYLEQWKN